MMDGFGGWGPGFGWFFMLLLWGLVILGIVAIVKWLMGAPGANTGMPPPKTARQILEERYARGEIDREDFEQKKRDLEP